MKNPNPKTTGNIQNINLDLTLPIPFTGTGIELKDMTVLTGPNGSGKSFFLVMSWVAAFIMAAIVNQKLKKELWKSFASMVFQRSFTSSVSGTIKIEFSEGATMDIEVYNNNVVNLDINTADAEMSAVPIFMSTALRLFADMNLYMTVRNAIVKTDPIEDLSEMYRLYDITFMEAFIARLPLAISLPVAESLQALLPSLKAKGAFIDYRPKSGFVFRDEEGLEKRLDFFSVGEQSIINMYVNAGG